MFKHLIILLILTISCESLAVPKPMESAVNYNVLMVHGAYGSDKGIENCSDKTLEATKESEYLTTSEKGANIGYYHEKGRLTSWLESLIFEDTTSYDPLNPFSDFRRSQGVPYIYSWRAFTNPANSSINNAHELGDRKWNGCGQRRALVEESQEVRAVFDNASTGRKDSGQVALDSIRKYPDLYRQIPSRYILVAHSMGGIASREWIQNSDYYYGDVDKVITLDSPHEGTGALNAQLRLTDPYVISQMAINDLAYGGVSFSLAAFSVSPNPLKEIFFTYSVLSTLLLIAPPFVEQLLESEWADNKLQNYKFDDPLVDYLDPSKSGRGHIDVLKEIAPHDSLPMFRLLGGTSSMTFTDINEDYPADVLGWIIPNAYVASFGNLYHHWGMDSVSFTNAMTGGILGLGGNLAVWDDGTALVSVSSGMAERTESLISPLVDVKRSQFFAAKNVSEQNDLVLPVIRIVGGVAVACETFGDVMAWNESLRISGELAIAMGGLAAVGAFATAAVWGGGFDDLGESHLMPLYKKNQETWRAAKVNSYSRINAGDTSWTPYLMEDFLYERPFVNLALNDNHTLHILDSLSRTDTAAFEKSTLNRNCYYIGSKNGVNCALGLFKSSNDLTSTHKEQSLSSLTQPLRFKSESDWSKMGVKVDRWEKVDGLTPEGTDTSDYVPIRHVERYEVPDITVYDWINKYSFVVDDLMPHRLRQIRMNFNYQEEIAWECDITEPENSDTACIVYKRSGGGNWAVDSAVGDNGRVKHPVKKNGLFDFVPDDYGYNNKLALQKDNQNTVIISTVNKIGLSNTQHLYYLFKATANKLDPVWPQRDVVLNKIKGFKSYATALGYQGFKVMGAKDRIVYESGNGNVLDSLREMVMAYDTIFDVSRDSANRLQDLSSAYFSSKWEDVHPAEGNYHWMFVADIRNMASASDSKDSSNTYNVPFRVDTTAPVFNILAEGENINPDSLSFVARFAWADAENSPDIRAMRISLEKANGNSANLNFMHVADFPALYDVCTPEFAIAWNDSIRESVRGDDGFYRIKVLAMDNAVPSAESYGKVNRLVSAISGNPRNVADSLWPKASDSLNVSVAYDTFFVDTKAPELVKPLLTSVSTVKSRYDSLARPARNSSYRYVTYDSLLKITYSMQEPLNGRDSSLVSVAWLFIHADDTTKVDHAGDSIYVKDGNAVVGSWAEMSAMRLEDGDYNVRAIVRDFAKNSSLYSFAQKLRVDKTAPHIESLVSTQLVYPDSIKDYSAKIAVNEKYDIGTNRTGVYCYYRVSGCGKKVTSSWKLVSNNVLKNDTVLFKLDSLEGLHGKCYLEAACVDAAGNVSVKTDLFYMGERTPVISSPRDSAVYSSLIAITGFAPPSNLADSLNTVYRLRYARVDSLGQRGEWDTSNVFVVSALRSNDRGYISKVSQSNDAGA